MIKVPERGPRDRYNRKLLTLLRFQKCLESTGIKFEIVGSPLPQRYSGLSLFIDDVEISMSAEDGHIHFAGHKNRTGYEPGRPKDLRLAVRKTGSRDRRLYGLYFVSKVREFAVGIITLRQAELDKEKLIDSFQKAAGSLYTNDLSARQRRQFQLTIPTKQGFGSGVDSILDKNRRVSFSLVGVVNEEELGILAKALEDAGLLSADIISEIMNR